MGKRATASVGDSVKIFDVYKASWLRGKITKLAPGKYVGIMFFDGKIKYIPWGAAWRTYKRKLDNVG